MTTSPAPLTPVESTPEPAKGRKRSPVYDVFELQKLVEHGADLSGSAPVVEAWVQIASGLRASSDREAIKAATADLDEDRVYGTFWAPLASNVRPRTRSRKVVNEDVWS